MPAHIVYEEYRDEQAPTQYPFAGDATFLTVDGFTFPVGAITEAALYPSGLTEAGFQLTGIMLAQASASFTLGVPDQPNMLTASFDRYAPPPAAALFDSYGRRGGMLLLSAPALFPLQTWPDGTHLMAQDAAVFVASCVRPVPELDFQGFYVPSLGQLFTGDLWFFCDPSVVLQPQAVGDGVELVINAVGAPLPGPVRCPDSYNPPAFVKSIVTIDSHGRRVEVPPDKYGNINLLVGNNLAADTVLRISTDPDGAIRLTAIGSSTS